MATLLITTIILSIFVIIRYGFLNPATPFGIFGIIPLVGCVIYGLLGNYTIERIPVTYVTETTSWKVIVKTSASSRLFESERMEDFNNWTSNRPGYIIKNICPFGIVKPESSWKFEVGELIEQQ